MAPNPLFHVTILATLCIKGLTSHSTQNKSFWKRSSQLISYSSRTMTVMDLEVIGITGTSVNFFWSTGWLTDDMLVAYVSSVNETSINTWVFIVNEISLPTYMASWCHCHSLSLASVKSRLVLVPAHPGNPGQSPGGRKTDVCVCVSLGI